MAGRRLNRIIPKVGPEAYKTYSIRKPAATHWRPATCAEVDCANHVNGWRTAIDETTELGQAQAHYIRRQSGRGYTETRDDTGLTVFVFEAGQACFRAREHRVEIGRPELYVVTGGDWRGNPRGTPTRIHTRPDSWVDDFANHQQGLADRHQQG